MDLDLFIVLPKPATRCPLGAPPIPPAVRSQAEEAMALPSSLLSPAPLCAFLALYPEPAAGSGCASISSAHDPSAAFCELSSDGASVKVGCAYIGQPGNHPAPSSRPSSWELHKTVSVRSKCARCAAAAPKSHHRCPQPTNALPSIYSRELCTYPCLRLFGSRAVRAWLEEAGRSLPVGCVLF
jgi:hypothetical protein